MSITDAIESLGDATSSAAAGVAIIRIKVSGDLEGDFVVIEARGEDAFVIAREPSLPSLKNASEHSGTRPANPEEFAAFEAKHGPFLPPDGEG
jgi:hypothetical protein